VLDLDLGCLAGSSGAGSGHGAALLVGLRPGLDLLERSLGGGVLGLLGLDLLGDLLDRGAGDASLHLHDLSRPGGGGVGKEMRIINLLLLVA
jgi:hypothetical protein